jgi:hypothetical protein
MDSIKDMIFLAGCYFCERDVYNTKTNPLCIERIYRAGGTNISEIYNCCLKCYQDYLINPDKYMDKLNNDDRYNNHLLSFLNEE